MDLTERNELRRRIWDLDAERQQLLAIADEYRPVEKLQQLTDEINALEDQIQQASTGNGSFRAGGPYMGLLAAEFVQISGVQGLPSSN
ncbi:hypothetical protein [Marinobacterium stanieri]|uniref:hypothetical protein n=1 Tax=Marinobacterium stanieri TaxID=49186 RepID=UPI000255A5EE|nr:hypothetical protein [Marinobacterium stanieri]